jgi:hypothetical protein
MRKDYLFPLPLQEKNSLFFIFLFVTFIFYMFTPDKKILENYTITFQLALCLIPLPFGGRRFLVVLKTGV